jgi:hypothetical protein
MWTCPQCGTKIDPSFDVCWNCGTSKDGTRDPSFVSADAAGPIEDPPEAPRTDDEAHSPRGELVAIYQAFSLIEAQFLANELSSQGIPAVADAIDMQDALGTLDGNPRVYCGLDDADRARAWLEAYDAKRKAEGPKLEP